jgi:hypothetical protein
MYGERLHRESGRWVSKVWLRLAALAFQTFSVFGVFGSDVIPARHDARGLHISLA